QVVAGGNDNFVAGIDGGISIHADPHIRGCTRKIEDFTCNVETFIQGSIDESVGGTCEGRAICAAEVQGACRSDCTRVAYSYSAVRGIDIRRTGVAEACATGGYVIADVSRRMSLDR